MRPLTTLALFLTSVVLGGVIWWVDRDTPETEMAALGYDAGAALVRMIPDTIGRVVVKRPGGEAVLEKEDGFWFLRSPVEDRADSETMESLLDLLTHLTVLDQIPIDEVGEGNELSPEALGLTGDQVIRIELTPGPADGEDKADGPTQVLLLGNPTPLANSIYARVPDDEERPDIYVVDGNPRKYLDEPVAALRDRHLFLAPSEEIVEITVKTPRGDIVMERQSDSQHSDWTLTHPLQTRADLDRVDKLLASLSALRVDEVTASGELPGPPPNPIPDGSVALQLFRRGVESPLTLFLKPGKEKTEGGKTPLVEVLVSDRPAVFQVRTDLLEHLPASPNAFRDPHLASIPLQTVFGIGITSRGLANPPVILKTARTQEGVRWYSQRNGVEEPANTAQIISLIEAINKEEVIDFVSDTEANLADYNLASPAVEIAISHYEVQPATAPDGAPAGSAGQIGITKKVLQLGYQETEVNGVPSHRLFATFAGEPFIYEISPAFAENVPTHPLKWKDLRILSFTPISLREIIRRRPAEGTEIKLIYDYKRNHWDAFLDGVDKSDQINKEAVRKIQNTLGSLSANRWLTPSPQAFQALENPDAEFEVTVEEVDRATGGVRPVTHVLRFAKATEAIDETLDSYYGRLDDMPDIFQIDYKTYRDLIVPPLGTRVETPE
ncbi:MAG: DUF4340 domain-containing protein [Verrucomicrobiae bacterium]|nr:DUF4340 domain-containing protein [Verrucomicrobiae bacterium]